ncbi:MAG TPA: MlaE family lipid ABC transporter permease subunit [Planctomycetota bacterium]|nr:MlaE family lipid ABC transporter permease subunit [Planctomycetota bacterium]
MSSAGATLEIQPQGDALSFVLKGRLDSESTGSVWRQAFQALERSKARLRTIDAVGIDYCDGAGIGLLVELRRRGGPEVEIHGLAAQFRPLLDLFPPVPAEALQEKPRQPSLPEEVGKATMGLLRDLGRQVAFIGELVSALAGAVLRPRGVRWSDALRVAEEAGVNALPIISLMGFLIGLILAFQSASQLKIMGAEVFVADLVAVSVVRELGPLMTAILLAGRSGAAFAAEIGTMKVNEEVDALTTMGLAPVRFLVVPRVLAGLIMGPLLTIYFDLVALVGGAVVVTSFGHGLVVFTHHVQNALTVTMFVSGMIKTVAFGLIIAGVGCQRGLQTGTGAVAVGLSTTRSVVAGILLTILVDGVFAGVYFALGI